MMKQNYWDTWKWIIWDSAKAYKRSPNYQKTETQQRGNN